MKQEYYLRLDGLFDEALASKVQQQVFQKQLQDTIYKTLIFYRYAEDHRPDLFYNIRTLSSENSIGAIVAGIEEIKNSIDDLEAKTLEMLGYDSTFRLNDATVCRASVVLNSMRTLHKEIAEFCGIIRKIIEGI